MKSTLTGLALAAALLLTMGCSPRRFPEEFARPRAESSESHFKNLHAATLTDRTIVGYVETQSVRPKGAVDPVLQYHVHTPKFIRVGLVTERGETFRAEGAEMVLLGHFSLEEGVRRILNAPSKVQLVQMESGR